MCCEIMRPNATVLGMYHPSPAALKREFAWGLERRYAGMVVGTADRARVPVGPKFHWNRRKGCKYKQK